jgi:hypothetical protein
MPSSRSTRAVFLVTALGVAVLLAAWVVPGFAATRCAPSVEPSTSPGHWFCSETVTLQRPSGGCEPPNTTVHGPVISRDFQGYLFRAFLFSTCFADSEPATLGLNATITQPDSLIYRVTVPVGFAPNWWNWTSPTNRSGLQWTGSVSDDLGLLVAP